MSFHVLLPLVAYGMLVVSAFVARSNSQLALFLVGAATLLFLFLGIHNAWDAITWHVFTNRAGQRKVKEGEGKDEGLRLEDELADVP